jgi:hypothetical protein
MNLMKCLVNDGRDAVDMNGIKRYCWIHYQIYNSHFALLMNSLTPNKYKEHLIQMSKAKDEPGTGDTFKLLSDVARVELEST